MIKTFCKYLSIFLLISLVHGEDKKISSGTILFLGDSLTAGYGLKQEQAFPQLIKDKLDGKGLKFKVLNGGVSGNTSAGGVRRVNWYFKTKIDVLVLALGANDGLRGLPIKSTKENLQKIIDAARKKNPNIKIVLAGMKVPPNMGKDYFKNFEELFPKLAKDNSCELVPFLLENVAGLKDFNLPDGIHPNAEGHKRIAETVFKSLKNVISMSK